MAKEKLKFKNSRGESISAWLERPQGEAYSYAIFAHCFTCTKNLSAIRHISRAMNRAGFAVLSFDFTGLGESEGDFADTNFSTNVEDLVAAADFLKENHRAPAVLVGHSLGGAAVLQAAARIDSVLAVATVGAPAAPEHVTKHFQDDLESIRIKGEAKVHIGGRPFTVKKQFLDDLDAASMEERIRNLKKSLLVIHSPVDNTVGVENAARIFEAARHPKSFISLDGADHLLSKKEDSLFVGDMVAHWARRYLPVRRTEDETAVPALPVQPEGRVLIKNSGPSFLSQVQLGRHALSADEPVSFGGTDQGPGPYDFLLAALGACTAMTLRMYANLKKFPLKDVRVTLEHKKIHAEDCKDCETKEGKIDEIERGIELEGDLDEDTINRLMVIADKCPVHRTLKSEIKITTKRGES